MRRLAHFACLALEMLSSSVVLLQFLSRHRPLRVLIAAHRHGGNNRVKAGNLLAALMIVALATDAHAQFNGDTFEPEFAKKAMRATIGPTAVCKNEPNFAVGAGEPLRALCYTQGDTPQVIGLGTRRLFLEVRVTIFPFGPPASQLMRWWVPVWTKLLAPYGLDAQARECSGKVAEAEDWPAKSATKVGRFTLLCDVSAFANDFTATAVLEIDKGEAPKPKSDF